MVNFSVFLFGYQTFRKFSNIKEDIIKEQSDENNVFHSLSFYFKGESALNQINIDDAINNQNKITMREDINGDYEVSYDEFKKVKSEEEWNIANKNKFTKTENAKVNRIYYFFGAFLVIFSTYISIDKSYDGGNIIPLIIFALYIIIGFLIMLVINNIIKK